MSDDRRFACHAVATSLPREAQRAICGRDGSVYLWKFLLAEHDGERLYLHRFMRSDEDRELHNHPWPGRSLILVGGYLEERREADRVVEHVYAPGDINALEANTFHRVDLLERDCWTLFWTGPKEQSWGFWDRDIGTFTPWRDFIKAKGLDPTR